VEVAKRPTISSLAATTDSTCNSVVFSDQFGSFPWPGM
jgi:hypothetical protein